jgi:hypothetical protein
MSQARDGTDIWHCNGINRNVTFIDGAKFVADAAGAYRRLDVIAILHSRGKVVARTQTPPPPARDESTRMVSKPKKKGGKG